MNKTLLKILAIMGGVFVFAYNCFKAGVRKANEKSKIHTDKLSSYAREWMSKHSK